MAFGMIEEERVGFLETKLGEFVAGIGKGFGEVCDGGEKGVEAITVLFAELVGRLISDEFISAKGLIIEDLVCDAAAQFLQTQITTVNQLLNFLFGENVEIIEDFSD